MSVEVRSGDLQVRRHARRLEPARQDDRERAAATDSAAHRYVSSVSFRDPLGQRESEPGPLVFLGSTGVELLELDEESLQVRLRDAQAAVLDADPKEVRSLCQDANLDAAAVRRELDRVRDVVVQN